MGDFFMNNTSLDESYNNSNITTEHYDFNYAVSIMDVVTCIIASIGIPLTLVAIYALYSLVRKDHVAPIYVINLLISDLIQFCCMITEVAKLKDPKMYAVLARIYTYSLMVSVSFMVCIALERYLVFACPLWYRLRRTIKVPVMVCVMVWVLSLVFVLTVHFLDQGQNTRIGFGVFFVLPCPLFIFFLVGTLKALSPSISVPSVEKRRIVGVLVLVLVIYILLFLPSINLFLISGANQNKTLLTLTRIFLRLSPLADLVLYIFMRKGTVDKLLASVCCCRMDGNESSTSSV